MKKQPFRFTLFLLICLSLPMIATAQTVDIPDSNLRAAIETTLGTASGDPITAAEMATLIYFDAKDANISDLTGLEYATNLTYLFLWNNAISDLTSLGGLTSLQFLDLQGNSVSDLSPVMGLTNLIFLGLRDNSVSELSSLVANTGLGEQDGVRVEGNLLNYPSIYTHIPTLQSRGVEVRFDSRTPTIPQIISGDNQNDTVGVALAQPFVVEVRDENGEVFEGVPVVFTVTAGGGTVQPEIATTDADGLAQSTLTLGSDPGTNTVEGGIEGIAQTVVFSAEATPPPPAPTVLSVISGDNQSGLTGEALVNPFVVEVRDQYDDPMEGVTVTFAVLAGDGSLSSEMGLTDANGQAESTLTFGSDPGGYTVEVSVEGVAETVTFNAIAELREFDLSLPAGLSLIHIPLKVRAVDGVAGTIESVGDLYDALGGADTVNLLMTYDPEIEGWHSYLKDSNRGTVADRILTDYTCIITAMKTPVSVRLGGDALGTDGLSTIPLYQGVNLIGLPLRDSRITRVSDLFGLKGIRGNVPVIVVLDNGEFKAVVRAGDDGDIEITGGQSFILFAQQAATVAISGEAWTNISETDAAPPIAIRSIEERNATPVLALTGSIIDEGMGVNQAGIRVILKNLSTGREAAAVTGDNEADYRLTIVDIETGQAAQIGDILEISAISPDASIGVQPLRYTVTAEDVKRSRIQLPALVVHQIPAETELLRNYPNPFNPETWIPYRLAEDAFVTLTIYDGSGRVVRTLDVGHQVAAVYESRSKAVYWDGRNEVGERVASGVYFYHLSAGDFSATRKMLILK